MRKLPFASAVLACAALLYAQHPHPQPRPGLSVQTLQSDGSLRIVTGESPLPPGQNFLLTVDSDMFDSNGVLMANTEPSRPSVPYNLMSTPVVSSVDRTSPTDDLDSLIGKVQTASKAGKVDSASIQLALDILEGNPIASRPAYSGFAVLHYTGPEKFKPVQPVFDGNGKLAGGNLNVHQIWYDQHIESDTSLIDPSQVQDVPWTITFTVDVLHRGADDFSPFSLFFDAPPVNTPGTFGPPHVGMDSTFFPMQEGSRYVMVVKMPPGKYYNLTYNWGWRRHPPRVQVIENTLKVLAGKNLRQWEIDVFGPAPRSTPSARDSAIAKLGELSPEKRMWLAFRKAQISGSPDIQHLMRQARAAFDDWNDRTSLPAGVKADPSADVTLFYANNTIYGNAINLPAWTQRPGNVKVTLLNADHFVHGYQNVDFGGSRGWENQFQSSVPAGGTGCDFTFGRAHWWSIAGGQPNPADTSTLIDVSPISSEGIPGQQKISFVLNYDPSARIKFYQFDPYHHDVAVFSMH